MKKSLRNFVIGGLATLGSLGLNSCGEDVINPEQKQDKPKIEESVEPKEERYINLDGEVTNYVDFNYNAELKNVDEVDLRLYHEGSQNSNTRTANSSISGTYENLLKGNYTLRATSDTLEATKNFAIRDWEMTADLGGLKDTVKYNSEINWNLEGKLSDKNVEDTVKIEGINSEDFDISINGYEINLKPKPGVVGNNETKTSTLELMLKSGTQEVTKNFSVDIFGSQHRNYSGTLEDNITNEGAKGEGNVYREVTYTDQWGNIKTDWDKTISQENYLGHFETDIDGNFNFKVDESVEGNLIGEFFQSGDANRNYARTIDLSDEGLDGLLVRTHKMSQGLYNEGVSKEEFRNFSKINYNEKWDLDEFQGISIFNHPSGKGTFTNEQMDLIEQFARENISTLTGGRINSNELYVAKDTDGDPSDYEGKGEENWLYVHPDKTLKSSGGMTGFSSSQGKIKNAIIRLRDIPSNDSHTGLFLHELGHAYLGRGHTTTLGIPESIMSTTFYTNSTLGKADSELGYIYDETYSEGEFYGNPVEGDSDNLGHLLGDFHNYTITSPKVYDNINQ